jgi:serine/threonine-protein kinase
VDDLDSDDPHIGEVLAGRYRLVRALGDGNWARVYVAQQIAMGRNVAVKLLRDDVVRDTEAVARFHQEIRAVARLRSPHTIQFHDVGESDGGAPFIAMELLAGETLRQRLDREVTIPADEVISIAAQIGASLEEAHDAGVLHRDLKPENVYLCSFPSSVRPFVKVLDFGLAKWLAPEDDPRLSGERQVLGTPAYMAPEMIVKERSVDHRADIYALGVMCFEMLTGHRPFHARTPLAMALAHVTQPVPRVTDLADFLPPAADDAFDIAMAKDAGQRSDHATAVAALLADAFAA